MSQSGDDTLRQLPRELWEKLRADPTRAPEHLALAAAEFHGPAAAAWVAEKRATFATEPAELARMAKLRHASLARFGGAATGLGGFVTVLPDLAALAWIHVATRVLHRRRRRYDPATPCAPPNCSCCKGSSTTPRPRAGRADGLGRRARRGLRRPSMDRATKRSRSRLLKMWASGRPRSSRDGSRAGLAVVVNAVGNERDTRALATRIASTAADAGRNARPPAV
jgi:hypothetical protein